MGLAAGGVMGSGWLSTAGSAYADVGSRAIWAWVIGGALMLLIAVVMVELGIALPKTGGLIFLPLQAAGPLVATVVAAGLWIVYAANPASEAVAMVRGLAHWLPQLLPGAESRSGLSTTGWLCAVVFLALIVGLNMLPPRRLIRLNFFVTVVKVVIPVLAVICLGFAAADGCTQASVQFLSERPGTPKGDEVGKLETLSVVLGGGVIYAYIGFQAPLDFAGNVKRRGMGEAARLRWAVYGTLVGAFLVYTALQCVFIRHCGRQLGEGMIESPYSRFAYVLHMTGLAWLLRLNAILSPMGSGIVFAHALTREVAALSRAHLTHRGLQTARRASFRFRGGEIDAYWLILLVNFAIGLAMLALARGHWGELVALNSVPSLVVYAMPGVVLVALKLPAFRGTR
ncbi:APC family permease, partial [Streptomyces poonensis]|uniref:APC family permease n=1 Tax=Streptomyces poonensis TaxID=68255 RepID=UPI00167B84A3